MVLRTEESVVKQSLLAIAIAGLNTVIPEQFRRSDAIELGFKGDDKADAHKAAATGTARYDTQVLAALGLHSLELLPDPDVVSAFMLPELQAILSQPNPDMFARSMEANACEHSNYAVVQAGIWQRIASWYGGAITEHLYAALSNPQGANHLRMDPRHMQDQIAALPEPLQPTVQKALQGIHAFYTAITSKVLDIDRFPDQAGIPPGLQPKATLRDILAHSGGTRGYYNNVAHRTACLGELENISSPYDLNANGFLMRAESRNLLGHNKYSINRQRLPVPSYTTALATHLLAQPIDQRKGGLLIVVGDAWGHLHDVAGTGRDIGNFFREQGMPFDRMVLFQGTDGSVGVNLGVMHENDLQSYNLVNGLLQLIRDPRSTPDHFIIKADAFEDLAGIVGCSRAELIIQRASEILVDLLDGQTNPRLDPRLRPLSTETKISFAVENGEIINRAEHPDLYQKRAINVMGRVRAMTLGGMGTPYTKLDEAGQQTETSKQDCEKGFARIRLIVPGDNIN